MAKSKKNESPLRTVNIPADDFSIIKKFVDDHGYKIGTFLGTAGVERVRQEKILKSVKVH